MPRRCSRPSRIVYSIAQSLLPGLLIAGCGDGTTAPVKAGDGQLILRVYQEGLLLDRDLGAQVDGQTDLPLKDVFHVGGGWGSVMLSPGEHDVTLTGLDPNCQPSKAGPTTVLIRSGGATGLNLHVSCRGEGALGLQDAAVILDEVDDWGGTYLQFLDPAGRLSGPRLDWVSDVSWAPDGVRFAAIDFQGPIIGNRSGEVRRLTWPGASSGMVPSAIAWAPGQDLIAALDFADPARCRVFTIQGPSWNEWHSLECGRGLEPSGSGEYSGGDLAWSPDGTQLLVSTTWGILAVVSASTGAVTELPSPGSQYRIVAVAWSPTGEQVALSTTECLGCGSSPASAFVVTISTRTLRPLAQWTGFPMPLAWAPDGSGLIVGTRQVELSGQACTVTQVVPINQPEAWRPLRPCGTGEFLQIATGRGTAAEVR